MKKLKIISLVLVLFAFNLPESFADSVYNIKGVEVKYRRFNPQRTRGYASDLAVKKGFYKLLQNIILKKYYDKEFLTKDIDFKKSDLVESFNIVEEDISSGYWAKFDIYYNPTAVKKILKNKRVPYTQEGMGNVLILPVKENLDGTRLLFEENNILRTELEKSFKDSGLITPIFPKGELEEITLVKPYDIMESENDQNILKLAKKYETNKAIIILMTKKGVSSKEAYKVDMKFINIDSLSIDSSVILGKSVWSVSNQIIDKIKSLWKETHLLEFNKPKRFVANIKTKANLEKFDDIVKKIKSISIVSTVDVMQINRARALIKTDFYGSPKEFLEESKKVGLKVYQENEDTWFVDYIPKKVEESE